ncbi:hypothetical protein BT63DRAFT_414702 [Microthyrium microscopicum]|uniref:CFEM domain-containing protein n=1 Tax=Microthyrium microscopicum TaxID=703497 RepID=A0A6A6UCT6_9PEZI|nr:hypothetical protein BT63DRAFT_414702 [Microthyrium microscopicum]
MELFFAALILQIAIFTQWVSGQTPSTVLPACGTSCLANALTVANCSTFNPTACACQSSVFVKNSVCCASTKCSSNDFAAYLKYNLDFCSTWDKSPFQYRQRFLQVFYSANVSIPDLLPIVSSCNSTTALPSSTPSATSSAARKSSSGLSTGAKAGLGVGVGLGALIVLAGALFFCMRRRKQPVTENNAGTVEAGPAVAQERDVEKAKKEQVVTGHYQGEELHELDGASPQHELDVSPVEMLGNDEKLLPRRQEMA